MARCTAVSGKKRSQGGGMQEGTDDWASKSHASDSPKGNKRRKSIIMEGGGVL